MLKLLLSQGETVGIFVAESGEIDLVFVDTLGGVTVCPPFGVEVVVAVVKKARQFEPLTDEAGQAYHR